MKNFYIIIGGVAVIGVVVVAFALRGGGSAASVPVDLGDIGNQELVDLAQGMVYGDSDAPVTIMEFGNYQCGGCAQFASMVKPQVDLAYIETGQAKFVFHDFPMPSLPHSFLAARAVRCAGDQGRYFDYHDSVFRTQRQWSRPDSPVGHFNDLAEELGLDTGAFGDCLNSDRHADVVTANATLGQMLGVNSTPSIFVHHGSGRAMQLGGFQFIDIQQAVEAGPGN
ncbi:MAG: DsbA family protein [Gemmatimonadetes bacterium]|nr:DsbA family protein [Gemmatimonadota bacterium]